MRRKPAPTATYIVIHPNGHGVKCRTAQRYIIVAVHQHFWDADRQCFLEELVSELRVEKTTSSRTTAFEEFAKLQGLNPRIFDTVKGELLNPLRRGVSPVAMAAAG